MRPRISTDFNRIKDAELLLKANAIIAAMTDNPNFPEPWPVQVPTLQVLRDAVAAFQTAVQDALTRDTTKILLRDKAWEYLVHQLLDLVIGFGAFCRDDRQRGCQHPFVLRF